MKRPFTQLEKKTVIDLYFDCLWYSLSDGNPDGVRISTGNFSGFFCKCPDVLSGCRSHCRLSSDKNRVSDAPAVFLWVPCTTVLFAISSVLSVLIPDANLWVMVINMLTIAGNLALWVLFLLDKREVRFIWGLTWSGPDSRKHFCMSFIFYAVCRKYFSFLFDRRN